MREIIKLKGIKRNYETTIGVIKKSKKTVQAVKSLDFSIHQGEILDFLDQTVLEKQQQLK